MLTFQEQGGDNPRLEFSREGEILKAFYEDGKGQRKAFTVPFDEAELAALAAWFKVLPDKRDAVFAFKGMPVSFRPFYRDRNEVFFKIWVGEWPNNFELNSYFVIENGSNWYAENLDKAL